MWLLYFIGKENKDNTTTTGPLYSEADRCPICLNCLLEKEVGFPESCNHVFCMTCILKWAEVSLRINIKYYSIFSTTISFYLKILVFINYFTVLCSPSFGQISLYYSNSGSIFSFIKNLNTYFLKKLYLIGIRDFFFLVEMQ